ncbi:MAG: MoaD/ThiS family protein [Halieaceae bacterium]|nr:MoaD/ThiS family protein [Halieaceae bacterium]
MASVVFASDMRQHTGGCGQTRVNATGYRAALRELSEAFPQLSDAVFEKYSIAIDGVIILSPLLETFEPDSELVFIPRIAGG